MSKPSNPRVTDLWAEDGCIYGYLDDALVRVWTPPGDDDGTAERVMALLDGPAPAEVARVTWRREPPDLKWNATRDFGKARIGKFGIDVMGFPDGNWIGDACYPGVAFYSSGDCATWEEARGKAWSALLDFVAPVVDGTDTAARVTPAVEVRGVVHDINAVEEGTVSIVYQPWPDESSKMLLFVPAWPGATVGDAVTVTVRKG